MSKFHECLSSGIEGVVLTRVFPYIFTIKKSNKGGITYSRNAQMQIPAFMHNYTPRQVLRVSFDVCQVVVGRVGLTRIWGQTCGQGQYIMPVTFLQMAGGGGGP